MIHFLSIKWFRFHPHACGERPIPWFKAEITSVHPRACGERLGNRSRARLRAPVHPRACGERLGNRLPRGFRAGSSPRVRGTPANEVAAHAVTRFIPARAGNTRMAGADWRNATVHPRACGERIDVAVMHFHSRRFIPARAGNADGHVLIAHR